MGKRFDHITEEQAGWIRQQPMFFVATAGKTGTINLSPKGMDSFRILGPRQICWLNLTGSGNETATHLEETPRMTIMFNAFDGKPKILRLYGSAACLHHGDPGFRQLIKQFPDLPGKRQVINMQVDLVQTSCGFGGPLMEFKAQRTVLPDWANQKGEEGIRAYWEEKNSVSLDGHQTHITKKQKV